MNKHHSEDFLRRLRNEIPTNAVIRDLLNLEVLNEHEIFRFLSPLCDNFHTATDYNTNSAKCSDC